MSNMSYVRFENTNRDLDDCGLALERLVEGEESLSESELQHAIRLVHTCQDILSTVKHLALQDGESIDNPDHIIAALERANKDAKENEE